MEANFEFWTCVQGLTIGFLAYNVHNHVLPLYVELERASERRFSKVVSRSVLIQLLVYSSVALAGYFSTLQNTPKIVLERPSLADPTSVDPFIMSAILLLIILMLIHTAVVQFPAKLLIENLQGVKQRGENDVKLNFYFFFISMLVACLIPTITDSLSIIGGICGSIQMLLMPALIYVFSTEEKLTSFSNLLLLASATGLTLTGFLSAGYTITRII